MKSTKSASTTIDLNMECLLKEDIGIEKFKSRIVLRQPFGRRPDPLGLIAET
jgi:hypothetical protein